MRLYCLGAVPPRNTTVSAATNASPIVLTLTAALGTGNNALNPNVDVLTIGGATVNTNANGNYPPGQYLLNSPTSITLLNKSGNGAYGGSGIASSPQQLIYCAAFPVIPGVTDNSKVMVTRMLFTAVPSTPLPTGTLFAGTAGLNQFNFTNVFRGINPPPAAGIYDFYDIDEGANILPIADYWIDASRPSVESMLTSFWIL